jgi:hypothetical protein
VTIEGGASHPETLEALQQQLRSMFNIGHVTLQLEPADEDEPSKLYQITRHAGGERGSGQ